VTELVEKEDESHEPVTFADIFRDGTFERVCGNV